VDYITAKQCPQHTNTDMLFLTAMFLYASYIWRLYFWANCHALIVSYSHSLCIT